MKYDASHLTDIEPRRFPIVFDLLASAELNLTTIRLLATHLTLENHAELLRTTIRPVADNPRAGKSAPTPVPASWPASPVPAGPPPPASRTALNDRAATPSPRAICPPPPSGPEATRALSASRYEFHFAGRAETYEKLQRAKDLLRHAIPNGEEGEIFDRLYFGPMRRDQDRHLAESALPALARTYRAYDSSRAESPPVE